MSPFCQETDEDHDGGVGEEDMEDQFGSPERLGSDLAIDCACYGWGGNARYRGYIPSAMRCGFADAASCYEISLELLKNEVEGLRR